MDNIVQYTNVSKSVATYHTQGEHGGGDNAYSTEKLKWTWGTNVTSSSKPSGYKHDWFGVDIIGIGLVPPPADVFAAFLEVIPK